MMQAYEVYSQDALITFSCGSGAEFAMNFYIVCAELLQGGRKNLEMSPRVKWLRRGISKSEAMMLN